MKRFIIYAFLLLAIDLCFSDTLTDTIEDAYFDLSGVWVDLGHMDNSPIWNTTEKFSWGKVENFDPFMGAVIDIGSKNGTV